MNIRHITLALLLLLSAEYAVAQEVYSSSGRPVTSEKPKRRDKGFDASHIIFGGGFGFGFGTVTNVSISPIVGYRFSDRFSAGVGFGYQYLRIKDYWVLNEPVSGDIVYKPLTANVYSPSVWTRYVFYKNLFGQIEYEHNFMSQKNYYNNYTNWPGTIESSVLKVNVPALLVGAGLRQPISERVSLMLMGLYDVLQQPNSPYRGTLAVRFGVVANF